MTHFETAVAVLAAHREARQWDDAAVARDLLARLGIDPNGGDELVVSAPSSDTMDALRACTTDLAQSVAAVDAMQNPPDSSNAADVAIAASQASFDAAHVSMDAADEPAVERPDPAPDTMVAF